VVEALAQGELRAAPVNDAERALLQFAELITLRAHTTAPEDTDRLRQAGWNDDQIAEAVYIIALFAFFNRVADAFGVPPMGYLKLGRLTP